MAVDAHEERFAAFRADDFSDPQRVLSRMRYSWADTRRGFRAKINEAEWPAASLSEECSNEYVDSGLDRNLASLA
jgi:hypothetical protein